MTFKLHKDFIMAVSKFEKKPQKVLMIDQFPLFLVLPLCRFS